MSIPKPGDRGVVWLLIPRQHSICHIPSAAPFDLA
jgi:hypothetical protein